MNTTHEGLVKIKEVISKISKIIYEELPSACVNALIRHSMLSEDPKLGSFTPAADCKLFEGYDCEGLKTVYEAAFDVTSEQDLNAFIDSLKSQSVGGKLIQLDIYVNLLKELMSHYTESARRAGISPGTLKKLRPPAYCWETEGGCSRAGSWYQQIYHEVRRIEENLNKELAKFEESTY